MSWIARIPVACAQGELRKLYGRVRGPSGEVDNIMQLHSLRPHTLMAHMTLYKSVLHHTGNRLPKWFLETIGVYVSLLNDCDYCVEHHFAGLRRLLDDDERATLLRESLASGDFGGSLEPRHQAAIEYSAKLTREPASVRESDVASLRAAGWDDGEILEINQVVSYFAYANRTVLGLGATTEGDTLGLSPRDAHDPDNWTHL